MAARPLQAVVHHLRRAGCGAGPQGASDAQLLERFAEQGDQDAFELLVWRHAGAVLGVCRRLLRHEQDAEDAFQAVFLALAREAGRISRRESVGGWLYRVACRVALRARSVVSRRAGRELPLDEPGPPCPGPGPCGAAGERELNEALDEQLARLPARYREVFVLRCLAGKSAQESARELGCPVGTVESRLARARQRLREGLARRGYAPEGVLAFVPASWVASAVRAAAGGTVGARAAALAEGVLKAMLLTRLKVVALVLFLLAGLGAGTVGLALRASAGQPAERKEAPPQKQEKQVRTGIDKEKAARKRLEDELRALRDQLDLMRRKAEVAEIRALLLKEQNEDLKQELERRKREIDGVLSRVDIAGNRIGLTVGTTKLALDRVPLAHSVKFFMGDKECTINDLKPGMAVSIDVKTEKGKSAVVLVRAHRAKK
jgi:RNA polymerase sigma factor (sigma-70 family)